ARASRARGRARRSAHRRRRRAAPTGARRPRARGARALRAAPSGTSGPPCPRPAPRTSSRRAARRGRSRCRSPHAPRAAHPPPSPRRARACPSGATSRRTAVGGRRGLCRPVPRLLRLRGSGTRGVVIPPLAERRAAYCRPPAARRSVMGMFRAVFAKRTWLETAYLLVDLPVGIVGFTVVVTGLSLGLGMLITLIGIPILTLT